MSDDQVKRYQLDYHHTRTYAEMAEDCDGDWVKYNDYKLASDRIEELELAVRYEADLAQMALDARKELAAKLAKAMNIAEVLSGCVEYDSFRLSRERLRRRGIAALAELKGETDE